MQSSKMTFKKRAKTVGEMGKRGHWMGNGGMHEGKMEEGSTASEQAKCRKREEKIT